MSLVLKPGAELSPASMAGDPGSKWKSFVAGSTNIGFREMLPLRPVCPEQSPPKLGPVALKTSFDRNVGLLRSLKSPQKTAVCPSGAVMMLLTSTKPTS